MVKQLKAEDGTIFKADAFKLRMIMCHWYLHLYYKGKFTGYASGPQLYNEALKEAEEWGLADEDRKAEAHG